MADDDSESAGPAGAAPVTSAELWIGRVLDARYRLNDTLGSGGFGHVFRAKHLILGRDVAVKILHDEARDPIARARFDREASTLAALSHPHIVTATDFGVSEGSPYLVMELVPGETLREVIDHGALAPERAIRLVVQILKALDFAHGHGIVHRDLKPTNVLVQQLGDDDHARLLDFGFAKFFGEETRRGAGNSLTERGTAFGTTGYIAPEQLGGAEIDGRCDLYAAGVILFEAIAGRRPFQVAEAVEELRATLLAPTPTLSSVREGIALASELDAILARALAKDPAERFESARDMVHALEALVPRASAAPEPAPPERAPTASAPEPGPASITPHARSRPPEWAMLAVLAGGGLLATAMIVTFVVARTWGDDAPEPAPVASAPTLLAFDAPDVPEIPLGPPTGDRPPPADPWRADVPPELAAMRAQLDADQPLAPRDRRELRRRMREQPWDARPHLLFAYAERARNALTSSIQSYERAYRADPSVRGDARMLRDLIVMASHASSSERATEAIATIYGTEAVPALDRALAVSIVDARARTRLERTRTRATAAD